MRALTGDRPLRADDLVRDTLERAVNKWALAAGHGPAGLAVHHHAQRPRQPGAPFAREAIADPAVLAEIEIADGGPPRPWRG